MTIVACDPMLKALPGTLAEAGVRWNADAADAIANADVVVLLVDHDAFRLLPADVLAGKARIDTRGLWA
jgi:UDP-N-acetyl-D-mannosaminuronic acid dehydrogenase